MAIYLDGWGFGLGLAGVLGVSGVILLSGNLALAQITPDATLGAESSVVTPNVNVRELPADRIDGGAVRGANLFHSFQEFNVGNGQRVYFANPTGIENILSRVTGNNLSNILGTLGVDGGANLFLLNPNGIIFGSNAQLDIAGSFVGSTANSVVFDNGYQFSAKNPEAPPLLTVSVPLGVQYGSSQPKATIANAGNLAVGQSFTLSAVNLDLQGQLQAGKDLTLQAQDTVKIRDSVTNPFVASAGGQLLVQGNQIVDIFALNHPNSGLYSGGDMVLRSPDAVMGDAHYWSGGNFRIEKLDGSLGDLESPDDPVVRASGDVSFASYRGASLHILAGGSVTISGNVTITGTDTPVNSISENVTLSDGITVASVNGNARPTVDIRAGTTAFGTPGITPPNAGVFTPGQPGTGGTPISANITIGNIDVPGANGLVLVTNQYQPNLALPGGNIQLGAVNARSDVGNGGSVFIDSRGSLTINPGFISTRSAVGNSGNVVILAENVVSLGGNAYIGSATVGANSRNAGNITIKAGSLLVNPGSFIDASTRGIGDAGKIEINVRDTISLSDSFISSSVEPGAIGNGGIVNIQAGSVLINNAGLFVSTGIGASGQGGRLTVNAGTVQVADGGVVDASTSNSSDAGSMTFNVNNLEVIRGGTILTNAFGTGNGGDISITATGLVNVNSKGSITTVSTQGNSGNLSISTGQLNVSDELTALTTSSGGGNAGELSIIARDSVDVSNLGVISTATGPSSTGNSGNLSISTGRLNVNNGKIDATSFGRGNAGNLSITATDLVKVSNGGFLTTGTEPKSTGNGGTLSISTRQLEVTNRGTIETVSAGTGTSGDLLIKATDSINIVNQSLLSASLVGKGTAGNTLIETGRLSIRDRSGISSSTFGARDGGNLTVRATDSVEVVNLSKLSSDTFGSGNAGNLIVETGTLSIRNAEVSTGTFENSTGRGGNLSIKASNVELIRGSIATATRGQGEGGDIRLQANSLNLSNEGTITSSSEGKGKAGDAGNIFINLSDRLTSNRGIIAATSAQTGGGDITITADDIRLRDSSVISTSVFDSTGGGGNITIKSTIFLALDDSDILANADAGPGGSITINSPGFVANLFARGQAVAVGRNPGDLSRFRNNGQVDISDDFSIFAGNSRTDISTASVSNTAGPATFPNVENIRGVPPLPSNLVDASELIDRRCTPNSSAKNSSFTITGRGGLPPSPNDPLINQDVMVNWITLEEGEENNNGTATDAKPSSSNPQPLVEAQGWVIGEDGRIILTASAPTVTPGSSGLEFPSCDDNEAATN